MFSQTVNNFFSKKKQLSQDYPSMQPAFKACSYEILQFLTFKDIQHLTCTNKFFLDLCDCHTLLIESFKGLDTLLINSVDLESNHQEKEQKLQKKSKLKEKFKFHNISINEYKDSEEYSRRLKSGKRRKDDKADH